MGKQKINRQKSRRSTNGIGQNIANIPFSDLSKVLLNHLNNYAVQGTKNQNNQTGFSQRPFAPSIFPNGHAPQNRGYKIKSKMYCFIHIGDGYAPGINTFKRQ